MFIKKTTVMGLSALALLCSSIDNANAKKMLMPQPEAIMSTVTDMKAMDDMRSTRNIRLKKCPNGLMVEYQYDCHTTYYKFCDESGAKVCVVTPETPKKRPMKLGAAIAPAPVEVAVVPVEVAVVPVEAAPVEAAPVEAVPVEAVPVEAVPVEAVPVEAVPVEAVPVEAVPVEAVPVEAAPVEVAPVEVAPVEVAPVEVAPVEVVSPAVKITRANLLNKGNIEENVQFQQCPKGYVILGSSCDTGPYYRYCNRGTMCDINTPVRNIQSNERRAMTIK